MAALNKVTPERDREAALALLLIGLLAVVLGGWHQLLWVYAGICLVAMLWPKVFRPFTLFWFGLSRVLGRVVSPIVLGAIYFVVVVPVGAVRRLLGRDPMRLGPRHRQASTAFVVRDHTYTAADLEPPY